MNPFKRASSHASPQHDADELRTLITELQRELDADLAKLAEKEHRQVDLIIAKKFEDAAKAATAIANAKAHIAGLRKSIDDVKRMLADKEREAAAILTRQQCEKEVAEYKRRVADHASASAALVRAAQVYAAAADALVSVVPEALGGRNLAQSVAHELPPHTSFVEGQVQNHIAQLLGGTMTRPRAVEPVNEAPKAATPAKSREVVRPRKAELHPAIEVVDRGRPYTASIAVPAA